MVQYIKQNVVGRLLAVVVCCALVMCGCDDDDDNGGASAQDNARFHGTYTLTTTETERGGTTTSTAVLTIGSDSSLQGSDMYIYVPATGASETYSGVDSYGDAFTTSVIVSGQTISWHTEGSWGDGGWTDDVSLVFAEDSNSGTATGGGTDTDVGSWTISGTFTRI